MSFMKSLFILLACTFLMNPAFAGITRAKYELELIPFKCSINGGLYRSRLAESTPEEKRYNRPSLFIQTYFPFKRSIDFPENFSNDSSYYDRLFSATPYAVFHLTDKWGNAVGVGQELSIRIVKRVYAKSQIGIVWVESSTMVNDGLKTGFNFHNYWFLSVFVSQNTALSFGYNHISNGRVFAPQQTSIYDMMTIGVSHSFKRKRKKAK